MEKFFIFQCIPSFSILCRIWKNWKTKLFFSSSTTTYIYVIYSFLFCLNRSFIHEDSISLFFNTLSNVHLNFFFFYFSLNIISLLMWDWGEGGGGVPHNFYYSFFYLIFCFKKIKHFSHHHYYYFTLQGFIYFFPILILLLFILYFVWYSTQHHHLPFPLTVFLNASHKNMWKHKKYNFSASFLSCFLYA